jgi:hypothetical protein
MAYKSKMPIDWHLKSLANQKITHAELSKQLVRLQERHAASENAINFYEKQIETAKEQGRDGFDPERFLQPKTKQ